MKTIPLIFLGLLLAGIVRAGTSSAAETAKLDAPALDTLAGPIALYPDTLIAVILPASTNPADIVLAARYLEADGDAAQIDRQPWDASVRALAHYPDVLRWMDENLAWTQQLGTTFIVQPEDMMASIQRLRAQAQTVGNLPSNEQLTVVNEDNYIRIIPARSEVVYVPYYDPAVVYVSRVRYYYGPAWPCGPWLAYDCNWIGRSIWIGTWSPSWYYRPAWRHGPPLVPHLMHRHTWRPNPHHPPPHRPSGPVIHPRPPRHWVHAKPPGYGPGPRLASPQPAPERTGPAVSVNPGHASPPAVQRPNRPAPSRQSAVRQKTDGRAPSTHVNRNAPPRQQYAAPAGSGDRPATERRHAHRHQPANPNRKIQPASPPPSQQAIRQPRPSAQPARPTPPPSRASSRETVSGGSAEKSGGTATSSRSSSSRDSSRQQSRAGRT